MKKVLLSTTAIIAAGLIASPASASEKIKLGLGGFMQQWVGFADNDDNTTNSDYGVWDQGGNTEIFFTGSTTLDNGIKIAVKVEMEGDGDGNRGSIDESWMDISSKTLGNLRLGADDMVTDLMGVQASDIGMGIVYWDRWVVVSGAVANHHDALALGNASDESKVTYISPRFMGVQVGFSAVPELGDGVNHGGIAVGTANSGAWAAAVNYKNKFNGIGINTTYGYYHEGDNGGFTAGTHNLQAHQAGAQITYGGFELAGGWANTNEQHPSQVASYAGQAGNNGEGTVWNVALKYSTGPYAVQVLYWDSEKEGTRDLNGNYDST
ncbi:MAG: porin, partial [Rhodospirillales bacterium]|nr:porin [Rhodospirillales bacterium]